MTSKYLASNDMLSQAIELATIAHRGQTDKAGKAAILHSLHVMHYVETLEEKIAAVLHDVDEDTNVDIEHIRHLTNDLIAEAVILLTRKKGEKYEEFIDRIIESPHYEARLIALKVKIQDLNHNMDLSRLPEIDQRAKDRQIQYQKAHRKLEVALANTPK
jgi:(p)ppGpp synthase/HD superfamily hydrolase